MRVPYLWTASSVLRIMRCTLSSRSLRFIPRKHCGEKVLCLSIPKIRSHTPSLFKSGIYTQNPSEADRECNREFSNYDSRSLLLLRYEYFCQKLASQRYRLGTNKLRCTTDQIGISANARPHSRCNGVRPTLGKSRIAD